MDGFFELVGCVTALAVVVGVVAFIVWLTKSLGRTARLERRLDELAKDLDFRLARLERAAAAGAAKEQPAAPPVAAPAASWPAVVDEEPASPPPLPGPGSAGEAATGESGESGEVAPFAVAAPEAVSTPAAGAADPRTVAPPRRSIEETLGARLPVWLGAIALALAALLLVKYSADRGLIGPGVRVGLGVAFGVTLLVVGRLLRRSAERIAAALAAAGVAALYAAFLAAVHLYALMPPALGFALMAATTAVAVALSLVHGPIVAVVGLVGGFLTPLWMPTDSPDPRGLFAYLLLLHVGLLFVARKRLWNLLALASLTAGLLWVLFWLDVGWDAGDGPWLLVFTLAALASWLTATLGGGETTAAHRVLAGLAAAGAFLASGAVTARAGFGTFEWAFVALLVAGLLVVARRREDLHPLAWVGAAGAALLLVGWGLGLRWVSEDLARFLAVAAVLGVLTAGGSYAALWGSRRPASWAALAATSGLAFTTLAWLGWRQVPAAAAGAAVWPWVATALGLAALTALAAVPLAARRDAVGFDGAFAALAAAAAGFVALAAVQGLDGEALTVALAFELPALAWLAGRFRLPVMVRLAALAAGVVAVRLLLNPWPLNASAGEPRLLNLLLWTYGPACLAFAAAALLLDRDAARPPAGAARAAGALRWGALALGLALVTLEIRHAFHPAYPGYRWGGPTIEAVKLHEWALVTVAWLAVGAALSWFAARRAADGGAADEGPGRLGSVGTYGSRSLTSAGLALALLGPCLALNPLWQGDPVGAWPLVNHLLWIYGAPALLVAWAAQRLAAEGIDRALRLGWRLGALVLLFVLVTLEARQPFRGAALTFESSNPFAEGLVVSTAWLLLGTALLVAGIATASRLLRAASLAVMGLAVVKVFLFDVAALGDLYRVLSFLGLGLSLLLLAWLYQRYVFGGGGKDEG